MVMIRSNLVCVICIWLVFHVTNGEQVSVDAEPNDNKSRTDSDRDHFVVDIGGPNVGGICVDCQNQAQLRDKYNAKSDSQIMQKN
ncbi:hypothetical protein ACLKA6_003934 [Drosophila palustris]